MKRDGRYDPEVSNRYRRVASFVGCQLVFFGLSRGGVPTTVSLGEVEQAMETDNGDYSLGVATLKNHQKGDLHVIVPRTVMQLLHEFTTLRRRLDKIPHSGFSKSKGALVVDLDGKPFRHLYLEIQEWAQKEQPGSAPFSANSVRRSLQTESGAKHPESTFDAMSRVQNHGKPVAQMNYNVRSKAAQQADYESSQNVRANNLINTYALENNLPDFTMKLREDFPDLMQAEWILKRNCPPQYAKYVGAFSLTEQWHTTLRKKWVSLFTERITTYFIREIEPGRVTEKDIKHELRDSALEDQTAVIRAAVRNYFNEN